MKKLYLSLLLLCLLSATPVLAATKSTTPAKAIWKPQTPKSYTQITWAKAPGIASFFRTPEDSGTLDYITRIYLPQNQIGFIVSTSTPIDLTLTASTSTSTSTTELHNFSFERLGAEKTKALNPAVKFLWDAPFFNMKPLFSDLSMATKYSVDATTTISSGSRSVPDMSLARRMLLINNKTGTASIKDFDLDIFTDNKTSDQALEGFAPTVYKSDNTNAAASRLFLGVSKDGRELVVYCSQLATTDEASNALVLAGIPLENQLQADGGGSASCGYNLPGQFFVEPTRNLPMMMGAETILARGVITAKTANLRNGPTSKNKLVGQLAKGAPIRIFEEKNGWCRISKNEWLLKSLIKQL
jgi:uncharacterized protein YgiM (DUF1202 family)